MSAVNVVLLKIQSMAWVINGLMPNQNSKLDALEEELGALNGQLGDMQECSDEEFKIVNDALDSAYDRFNDKRLKVFNLPPVKRPPPKRL